MSSLFISVLGNEKTTKSEAEKRPKESKNQSHYTLFCLHSAKALFELSLKGYSARFDFLYRELYTHLHNT